MFSSAHSAFGPGIRLFLFYLWAYGPKYCSF